MWVIYISIDLITEAKDNPNQNPNWRNSINILIFLLGRKQCGSFSGMQTVHQRFDSERNQSIIRVYLSDANWKKTSGNLNVGRGLIVNNELEMRVNNFVVEVTAF